MGLTSRDEFAMAPDAGGDKRGERLTFLPPGISTRIAEDILPDSNMKSTGSFEK